MRKPVRLMIALACFFFACVARAENYPSRLIKATIPFGAGSAADVVPRVVFDRLAAELGQSIVVENRPGAGGTLGTAMVVKPIRTATAFLPNPRRWRSRRRSIPD
jgi:tripartite-type tricarboxylate transporter receptor subunit TctC